MNREVRKLKMAMGSEEDPGTEQDAGAGSWRWTDEGFSGDVLEDGVELSKSEEAELWVECIAGQVLSARPVRGPDSGSVLQLAWQKSITTPSCLPCLAAKYRHLLWWSVLGTADRFLIHF